MVAPCSALGTAGDRTDEIVRSLGEMAARDADVVVIVHKQDYLRGRDKDELSALYREGAAKVGVGDIPAYDSELDGLEALLARAVPGDVVAVMCHQDREQLDEWLVGQGATVDTPDVLRDKVMLADGSGSDDHSEGELTRSGSPTARRRRHAHRPGPATTRTRARRARPRACRRRGRPGRPCWLATSRAGSRSISSSTISTCLQRAPAAIRSRTPSATSVGRLAALAAAQRRVLADHDHVEVVGRDRAELDHVLVAPVAGGGDDADPRRLGEVARSQHEPSPSLVDEVAEHPHARRVVAVVDDDVDALDLDLVEPAGGEVVVRRERPQALPDVVQRRTGGERGSRGGQRVLHVHQRPAAERRRQQVGPGELHLPGAVP